MPGNASRENGKKGGRPKGAKSESTIRREQILAALRERIMQSADSLFNAAKSSAIGNQFLFKIVTTYEGKKKIRSKPILVEDIDEISEYIDRLDRENRGDEIPDEEIDHDVYYFMSTKEPNIQAFKELVDRAFGRNVESVDLTSGGKPIPLLHVLNHKRNGKDIQP